LYINLHVLDIVSATSVALLGRGLYIPLGDDLIILTERIQKYIKCH